MRGSYSEPAAITLAAGEHFYSERPSSLRAKPTICTLSRIVHLDREGERSRRGLRFLVQGRLWIELTPSVTQGRGLILDSSLVLWVSCLAFRIHFDWESVQWADPDLIDLVSESTDKAKLAGWREHWIIRKNSIEKMTPTAFNLRCCSSSERRTETIRGPASQDHFGLDWRRTLSG